VNTIHERNASLIQNTIQQGNSEVSNMLSMGCKRSQDSTGTCGPQRIIWPAKRYK